MNNNKEISPAKSLPPEKAHKGFYCTPFDNSKAGIFVMKDLSKNFVDVNVGERFGMLTVIKEIDRIFVQPNGIKPRAFLCQCDCGNTAKVRIAHLRHNRVRSCGCLRGEQREIKNKGLQNSYRAMKARVTNKNNIGYKLYMGRGITMCDEWKNSYNTFANWAINNGYKDGLSIDRIDNNKGYCPENCRWVTTLINNCNRRNTKYVNYNGKKESLYLLLKKKGNLKHIAAIRTRIKRGWNEEVAIDTPIRKGNYGKKNKNFREAN